MAAVNHSTISIRFFGDTLDPAHITRKLGYPPSSAAKTGERIVRSNGKERVVKKGFWLLEYGESDAVELEEKFELLLGKLTDDLDAWREVGKDLDSPDIFCGLFIDNWNEGFSLTPSILKKVSDRGLVINFDIYSPTDSWDDGEERTEPGEGGSRDAPAGRL